MGIEAKVMDLKAAADFIGTGAIETPIFENEIMDRVRRGSLALQRFKSKPATGHPHRYFEQLAIAAAAAVDPRNLSATASGPTRVERPAFIKAVISQSNLSLFDKEVTEQQGQFASVVAQDIDDIVKAVEVKRGQMLWTGTDTSMMAPTTLEWMGALAQIGTQSPFTSTIAPGASIIDGIKSQVAAMLNNTGFVPEISSIYINSVLGDYIDQEAKAAHIDLKTKEVTAGVTVKYLSTQAGDIPLIMDPYLGADTTGKYGFSNPPGGNKNYYAVIMSDNDTEIAVISGKEYNPNPRIFQLGLTGNLAGQFVAVKFDTLIVKGATYTHGLVCVNRA